MKRIIRNILYPFLRACARMKAKKYDHVVTIGYNCEMAFRFFDYYKFVDATLFTWSGAIFAEDWAKLISQIDMFFTGEILPPTRDFPLYRCGNTGARAHGRAPQSTWSSGNPIPEGLVEKEIADIRSRMAHLREKTLGYLRDDKSVLVAYKMRQSDCEPGKAGPRVDAICAALEGVGARNMTFLVICEDRYRSSFPKHHPGYELRSVLKFNPETDSTIRNLGDRYGWRIIFDEFRPKVIKKQAHKFKFEQ